MEQRLIAKGALQYDPTFLSKQEADTLLECLRQSVTWEQKFYRYGGKQVPQPRLTAWYADQANMEYSYSGITQTVLPWLPELLELKKKIEIVSGAEYNSVLLNFYRDGSDSVGFHSDDEKELGENPSIASISLGAIRTFELREKYAIVSDGGIDYELAHGSLLIMSGSTQKYWQHSIPKAYGLKESRINLTFRKFSQ